MLELVRSRGRVTVAWITLFTLFLSIPTPFSPVTAQKASPVVESTPTSEATIEPSSTSEPTAEPTNAPTTTSEPTPTEESRFSAAAYGTTSFNQISYTITSPTTISVTLVVELTSSTAAEGIHVDAPLFITISDVTYSSTSLATCIALDDVVDNRFTGLITSAGSGTCTLTFVMTVNLSEPAGSSGNLTAKTGPIGLPIDVLRASSTVTVGGVVAPPTFDILLSDENPFPGDVITVSVLQTETGIGLASDMSRLQGTIPAGTTPVGGSALLRCNYPTPSSVCLAGSTLEFPVQFTAVYFPQKDISITATLTYQVVIDESTSPGTVITFTGNGRLGAGATTGPDTVSLTVAVPPVQPSIDIALSPTSAAPGGTVTVTLTQIDPGTAIGPSTITGTLPPGTTFVPDSDSISCVPACSLATSSAIPGSVTGSYQPVPNLASTVTLTYQVTVNADTAVATVIPFSGTGEIGTTTTVSPLRNVLVIEKTTMEIGLSASTVSPGDVATITVTLEDPGMSFAQGGVFGADLPTGVSLLAGSPQIQCAACSVSSIEANLVNGTVDGTYTAPADTAAVVTLTYQVTIDSGVATGTTITFTTFALLPAQPPIPAATASLIVVAPPVVATDQSVEVAFEGSVDSTLTATGGQEPLTFSITTDPTKGIVTLDPSTGEFTFVAETGQTGSDSFSFTASDSSLPSAQTDTGTVTITIGSPDELVAESLTVNVDTSGTATGNLADQVSGGIPPYLFALITAPNKGLVTISPDGLFTYTANEGESGPDSFTYTVTDSQEVPQAAAVVTGDITLIIAAQIPTPTPNDPEPTPTTGLASPVAPGPTASATSPVNQLPNTGTGGSGTTSGTYAVLALALLCLAAAWTHLSRRGKEHASR